MCFEITKQCFRLQNEIRLEPKLKIIVQILPLLQLGLIHRSYSFAMIVIFLRAQNFSFSILSFLDCAGLLTVSDVARFHFGQVMNMVDSLPNVDRFTKTQKMEAKTV